MPTIAARDIDEPGLLKELSALRAAIEKWAKRRDVWDDAGFHTPYVNKNEAPRYGEVLDLWFEGPLYSMFWHSDGNEREAFFEHLSSLGYEAEFEEHTRLSISPRDEERKQDFLTLYRWRWIQELAGKRLFDVHAEVFDYFARRPDALKELSWRQFEAFLAAVFRNQGFRTELGPGSNDGGVDIRLYQSESIPELVTLVQAKRYRRTPIKLDAVASLLGVAAAEKAPKGILATTSRYQPKARNFALTTQSRVDLPTIELVDLPRLAEWCEAIARQLDAFFTTGNVTQTPSIITNRPATALTGQIVVAHPGLYTTRNAFAVVEADYPHEVVLRPVGSKNVSGDGFRGQEVVALDKKAHWTELNRIVAIKGISEHGGRPYYWGERRLFKLWDGTPCDFDMSD